MLKLYDYFRSSAAYRVRIALHLKSLNYEAIPIHLTNQGGEQYFENYQVINPQSLVPSLEDDDKVITQSLAIIEYLNDVYPEPALLPQDAYEKALVRAFALNIIADLHPLNNLRVLKYLTDTLHVSEQQKTDWYHHWIARGLSALEKRLNHSKLTGKFCFGYEPSLADICLIPQLLNAKRFNCDTSNYPTLMRINAECLKLPAFFKTAPQEQTLESTKG